MIDLDLSSLRYSATFTHTKKRFVLNNEMTDFQATGSDADGVLYANRPDGGKMPRRTAIGEGNIPKPKPRDKTR